MIPAAAFQGVDAEHPWPGLVPFTEEIQGYFHGRDNEAAELLRLIKREPLTVLFGQSGLGKSSLLSAGLFPRLRHDDFLPVYIRLEVSPDALAFGAQVRSILAENLRTHGVDARAPREDESLWAYFHAAEMDFWSARNRLLTPVLVLDQFEEIFTLGRHSEEMRARCRAFVTELGDLIENRTPESVVQRLEENPDLASQLDFSKRNCKVLLAFREDFLPDFEGLRRDIRSIMQNRMRLTRMNGAQALEAITQSGGHLIDSGVAGRIISFVAGPRAGDEAGVDYTSQEIEPALLSLVCRELNNKRIAEGRAQITGDLLEAGAQQEIISNFYERSLANLDPGVRVFVEDQLLTEAGYRDSYALDDARRLPGVTPEAIDTLVARRLLRLDERFGVLRIELTHDVLTRVVRDSRDQRQVREAEAVRLAQDLARRRRTRRIGVIGVAAGVAMLGLAVLFAVLMQRAVEEKRRAVDTQSNVLLAQANGQLDINVAGEPQAILAKSMDLNPANSGAIGRAVAYLSQRTFPRLMGQLKVQMDADDRYVSVGWRDSNTVAFRTVKGTSLIPLPPNAVLRDVQLLKARDAREVVASAATLPERTRIVRGSETRTAWAERELPITETPDGRVVTWIEGDTRLRVAYRDSKQEYGIEEANGVRGPIVLSPDGRRLMLRTLKGDVNVYSLSEQSAPRILHRIEATDGSIVYGPSGHRLVTLSKENVATYDLASDRIARLEHPLPVNALEVSRDGKWLATACQDKFARLWNLDTGALAVTPLRHDGAVLTAAFSDDGMRLITGALDGTARLWSSASGKLLVEPVVTGKAVAEAHISPDGTKALTYALDGTLGLWQIDGLVATHSSLELPGNIAVMEVLPERELVAFATLDGQISLWRILNDGGVGVRTERVWAHSAPDVVQQLRFSPDGKYLAVASSDLRVHLWHTGSGKAAGPPMRHRGQILAMRFKADSTLLATGSTDGAARVWRVASQRLSEFPMLHGREAVSKVAFSKNGSLLLTGTAAAGGGALRIWDLHENMLAARTPVGDHIALAEFLGDESIITISDKSVIKWGITMTRKPGSRTGDTDAEAGLPVYVLTQPQKLEFGGVIWSGGISPDGARLVVGGLDGTSRMVDLNTFRPFGEAMKSVGVVQAADFSYDGRWIVTRSADYTARVWDSNSGYSVTDTMRHNINLAGAALVGGGAFLVSAGQDRTVALSKVGLNFPVPPPQWLPELVQVAGGGQFDQAGTMTWIADRPERLRAIGERIGTDDGSWWGRWAAGAISRLALSSAMPLKEGSK